MVAVVQAPRDAVERLAERRSSLYEAAAMEPESASAPDPDAAYTDLSLLVFGWYTEQVAWDLAIVLVALSVAASVIFIWCSRRLARLSRRVQQHAAQVRQNLAKQTEAPNKDDIRRALSGIIKEEADLKPALERLRASVESVDRHHVLTLDPFTQVRHALDPLRTHEKWAGTLAGVLLTLGLLFTFLGLSAALLEARNLDADVAQMRTAISALINKASAKFITSIAGLFGFIILSLITRYLIQSGDRHVRATAAAIAEVVNYIPPEQVLAQQLRTLEATRTQNDQLADNIATALDERLKATLDESLRVPFASFGQALEQMPEQISDPMVKAVSALSETIGQANQDGLRAIQQLPTLESTRAQNDQLANNIATALDERLKATLDESLRVPFASFGQALEQMPEQISDPMVKAVSALSETIGQANQDGLKAMTTDFVRGLSAGTTEAMDAVRETMLQVPEQLRAVLQDMERGTQAYGSELREAGERLHQAADRMMEALGERSTSLTETLLTMQSTLAQITGNMAGVSTEMQQMVARFEGLSGSLSEAVTGSITQGAATLDEGFGEITKRLEGLAAALSQTIEASGQAIHSGGEQAGRDLAEAMAQATAQLAQSLHASLAPFSKAAEGLSGSLSRTREAMDALPRALDAPRRALEGAGQTVGDAVQPLRAASDALRQGLQPVPQVIQQISSAMDQVSAGVQSLQATAEALNRLPGKVESSLSEGQRLLQAASEASTQAMDRHTARFGEADRALEKTMSGLREHVLGLSNTTTNHLRTLDEQLAKAVSSLQASVEELKDVTEDLAEALGQQQRRSRAS